MFGGVSKKSLFCAVATIFATLYFPNAKTETIHKIVENFYAYECNVTDFILLQILYICLLAG